MEPAKNFRLPSTQSTNEPWLVEDHFDGSTVLGSGRAARQASFPRLGSLFTPVRRAGWAQLSLGSHSGIASYKQQAMKWERQSRITSSPWVYVIHVFLCEIRVFLHLSRKYSKNMRFRKKCQERKIILHKISFLVTIVSKCLCASVIVFGTKLKLFLLSNKGNKRES